MMTHRNSLATVLTAGALFSLVAAGPAHATTILAFSQAGVAADFTATRVGSTTTLAANDLLVNISGFFAGGTPINGVFFDFNATNTGAAVNSSGLGQDYDGTFSFNSLANNTGIDYLHGTLTSQGIDVNDLTGADGGTAASFRQTTGGLDLLTFVSAFGDFVAPLGISLSFISVDPALSLAGAPLSFESFRASVTGNLEADQAINVVPEPASLVLFGSGMVGLAVHYRRRQRRA